MKLHHAVIIVTGASSGIGRETARVLAMAGARVVLVARNAQHLQDLADELVAEGKETLVVPADIASPEAARSVVQAALDRWGRIDGLINNAGIGIEANVASLPMDQLQYVFEVNLFGPLRLIQAALPSMRRGVIVNVSSPVAKLAFPGISGYAASKAALDAFSDTLRRELYGMDITVITVYPGRIDTNFDRARIRTSGSQRVARSPVRGTPLHVAQAIRQAIESGRKQVYVVHPIERPAIIAHGLMPRLFDHLIGWWFWKRLRAKDKQKDRNQASPQR